MNLTAAEVTPHPHDLQNVGPPPSSLGHPLPGERGFIRNWSRIADYYLRF